MTRGIIGFCIWVHLRDGKFKVEVVSLRQLMRRLRLLSRVWSESDGTSLERRAR
jgi:hypothetical protein